MDTGKGKFSLISERKAKILEGRVPVFREGEIIEIRGARFRIAKIETRGRMKLKLLKDKEEKQDNG